MRRECRVDGVPIRRLASPAHGRRRDGIAAQPVQGDELKRMGLVPEEHITGAVGMERHEAAIVVDRNVIDPPHVVLEIGIVDGAVEDEMPQAAFGSGGEGKWREDDGI